MHMTKRVWTCPSFWTTILLLQALVSLSGKATCAPQNSDAVEGRVLEETTEDGQHQQERSSDIYQRLAKLGDLLSAFDTDDNKLADIVDGPGQQSSKRDAEAMGSDGIPMWYGPRVGKAKREIGLGEGASDSNDVWFGPRLGKRAESWFGPRLGKREWYGPRLGKRAHVQSYYDDEQENLDVDQLLDDMRNKRTPADAMASPSRQWWGPVARRSPFVPRLGKRGDDEEHVEEEEYDISLATRAAFSPRLGKKNLSFAPRLGKKAAAFSPRLGKKSIGFAPRLGKRHTAFAPRLGKRAGLSFAPRLGRSDKSFDFAESDKRSAFSLRLGRSPAFAPRLGRAAFSPRLG